MKFRDAHMELHHRGITLSRRPDGEFRVNFLGGKEETAYYTPDLDDAYATGLDMAKRGRNPRVPFYIGKLENGSLVFAQTSRPTTKQWLTAYGPFKTRDEAADFVEVELKRDPGAVRNLMAHAFIGSRAFKRNPRRRRNVARSSGGMRQTPLTPEEITKFKILKKLGGKALERRLPAWAKKKTLERFVFTPGQPAKYPGWTYPRAPAPAELKIPADTSLSPAEYIKEFNRLNYLKNPLSKKNYIRIAHIFHQVKGEKWRTAESVWRSLLIEMADYLAADNPRFDRDRFYRAAEIGSLKKNPAKGQYGPRIKKAARQMVRKYGKRRARRIAGGMIGVSKSRRMKEHFVKVRRAINPKRKSFAVAYPFIVQGKQRGRKQWVAWERYTSYDAAKQAAIRLVKQTGASVRVVKM